MLDLFYGSLAEFQADCARCGYNWEDLLSSRQYLLNADGTVIAADNQESPY